MANVPILSATDIGALQATDCAPRGRVGNMTDYRSTVASEVAAARNLPDFATLADMRAVVGTNGQIVLVGETKLYYIWRTDITPDWYLYQGVFPTSSSKIAVDNAIRVGSAGQLLPGTLLPILGSLPLISNGGNNYASLPGFAGAYTLSSNPLFNATLTGNTSNLTPTVITNVDTSNLEIGMFVRSDAFTVLAPGGLATPTQTITINARSGVGPGNSITVSQPVQTFGLGQTFVFNAIDVSPFLPNNSVIEVYDVTTSQNYLYTFLDPAFKLLGNYTQTVSDISAFATMPVSDALNGSTVLVINSPYAGMNGYILYQLNTHSTRTINGVTVVGGSTAAVAWEALYFTGTYTANTSDAWVSSVTIKYCGDTVFNNITTPLQVPANIVTAALNLSYQMPSFLAAPSDSTMSFFPFFVVQNDVLNVLSQASVDNTGLLTVYAYVIDIPSGLPAGGTFTPPQNCGLGRNNITYQAF